MKDFSKLIAIADELDTRCAIVRAAYPEKAFEIDGIAAKAEEFRAFAVKLQDETIQTASSDDLLAVHTLMGETMSLIRMIREPNGTLQ